MEIGPELAHLDVLGVTHNSKLVKPGYLFVAVKGSNLDGHDFIEEAFQRGAVAAVCNFRPEGMDQRCIPVQDTRRLLPWFYRLIAEDPVSALTLVGITGTNGKTTTSWLLESILSNAGIEAGLIGTLGYKIKGGLRPSDLTTPDPGALMEIFSLMAHNSVTHVIMEVSSHSLDQHRVDACGFKVAVFTNLTRDHLDYHKTMDAYFKAKARLFRELLRDMDSWAVINADDRWGRILINELSKKGISYGFEKDFQIHPKDYELKPVGIKAEIKTQMGIIKVSSKLIGRHNLYNIMAAIGASIALNIPKESIEEGIADLDCVPGRLEPIAHPNSAKIFVDYAHTPDALEKVLMALRDVCTGRLLVVFGCGGDRDRGKRPEMGNVAARLSDVVVVTSDNPRTEEPMVIINEICAGIDEVRKGDFSLFVEPDRKKAIEMAIRMLNPNDILLVAGKGNEDYQIVGHTKVPFKDKAVIIETIRDLNGVKRGE